MGLLILLWTYFVALKYASSFLLPVFEVQLKFYCFENSVDNLSAGQFLLDGVLPAYLGLSGTQVSITHQAGAW